MSEHAVWTGATTYDGKPYVELTIDVTNGEVYLAHDLPEDVFLSVTLHDYDSFEKDPYNRPDVEVCKGRDFLDESYKEWDLAVRDRIGTEY